MLCLGVLGLAAAGCSDDTGGDESAVATATTAPSTSAPPASTSTVPTSTTATTVAVAPTPVEETVYVTVDETLVGWWDGAAWSSPEVGDSEPPPVEGAQLRSVDSDPDKTAGVPTEDCFPESGQVWWQLDGMDGVRASGAHDLLPRSYTEIGAAPAHVDAIRAVLDAEGVDPSVPVDITRVIRLDVEGDGVDEVIIEATRLPPPPTFGGIESGDYSILVMRRVLPDDTVENITLHVGVADLDLSGPYVLRMEMAEPIDVNGDGTFELATRWSYYEGGGVSIFELGAEPNEVLIAGCGV